MLKLFKTILKTGDATLKYPFAPAPVCDNFRGKPEYTPEQCIACGACAVACPPNAITMKARPEAGTHTWELFLGNCIFCGRCEEVCPTKAIVLSKEFELAVGNKADLYQNATFRIANCACCGKPFAPQKAVEYAIDVLKQTGANAQVVEERRKLLETCSDCKRKQSIHAGEMIELRRYLDEGKDA